MDSALSDNERKRHGFGDTGFCAAAVSVFLLLNALKIASFNMMVMPSRTAGLFIYKFGIAFLLSSAMYSILFQIRSRLPFAAFYLLQDAYILINLLYFGYFHSYLHIRQALALCSEGIGAAPGLPNLFTEKLLIALIDLPPFLCIAIRYRSTIRMAAVKYKVRSAAVISICAVVITSMYVISLIDRSSIFSGSKENNMDAELKMVRRYGTLANSLSDMAFNRDDVDLMGRLKYGRRISGDAAPGRPPNLVVIQVESLDSNAVNKRINGKYMMPFLHSLSASNVYYPYALSYHEAGGTSDCEFSAMNSVEPLGSFPAMILKSYEYPNSVVRQLAVNSYSTTAFHGNVGSYYSRSIAYPKMGYRNFFDLNLMGLSEEGWGAKDEDVFKFAERRLKEKTRPFFAYTITMSSHGPFTNVGRYYHNSNYESVRDLTTKNYLNSMSYVDQSLGDHVDYIRSNFRNTYIFIYGDHAPDINNSVYKQASFTERERYFEFVPVIIVTPIGTKYTEKKNCASFLDIAPTLAIAAGIPYSIASDGIDLLGGGYGHDIPYRGESFSREYLYRMAREIK